MVHEYHNVELFQFYCSWNSFSSSSSQFTTPFSALTLLGVAMFWWWRFEGSFAHLIAPVVTTTSFNHSCNEIQTGDILVPAYPGCTPGNWPLNERRRPPVSSPSTETSILQPNALPATQPTVTKHWHGSYRTSHEVFQDLVWCVFHDFPGTCMVWYSKV